MATSQREALDLMQQKRQSERAKIELRWKLRHSVALVNPILAPRVGALPCELELRGVGVKRLNIQV